MYGLVCVLVHILWIFRRICIRKQLISSGVLRVSCIEKPCVCVCAFGSFRVERVSDVVGSGSIGCVACVWYHKCQWCACMRVLKIERVFCVHRLWVASGLLRVSSVKRQHLFKNLSCSFLTS